MKVQFFIETHFSLMMVLACVAGLAVPGIALLPDESALVALALLMFVTCYKLKDGGFYEINRRRLALFYVLRFVLLPFALYALALPFAPDYAIGVFLVTAVPAGASSPAFINIYGGKVAIGFALVLLSQVLTPLVIPFQFTLLGGAQLHVSAYELFRTLALTILLPMALYALVRRHKRSAAFFYAQNKFFSILNIMFVICLVVAKQREAILSEPLSLILPLALVLACYAIYIFFGWAAAGGARETRLSYAVSSGFNNAALGVSLALVYFPPKIVLFFAAAEIGWALLPLMMKNFLRFFAR